MADSIITLPVADCRLQIVDWKKIGFLLKFTPDLFMGRNDKRNQRLQTRNVIPVPDFSGINLSGNPLIEN